MQATELAGLGKVRLVQESVAAVIRAAQSANAAEGLFLVYDLGAIRLTPPSRSIWMDTYRCW